MPAKVIFYVLTALKKQTINKVDLNQSLLISTSIIILQELDKFALC